MRTTKYAEAIAEIDVQIARLKGQIAELEQGRRSLLLLEDVVQISDMIPTSQEYKGLGWQRAAVKLLEELGKPMTTRELLVELLRRGLQSSSRNKPGTLSSAMKQRPDLFTYNRTSGEWSLKRHAR